LSPTTCQPCKHQKATLELRHTYDFLTWLRDEFEPLRAKLLAHHPCVSLMDALTEVHNEEMTRLQDAGLLRVSSILATCSSVARPTALMPPTSLPIVLSASHGASTSLHYDHCSQDGHVETFLYRKKKAQKAQTHHSS
jgi:hypothetical protein